MSEYINSLISLEQRHIDRNVYRSQLIELVRTNPLLWDKKSPDFHQRMLKMQKWVEISKMLGVSTDKLRRTWENLRDQYRRDLKRMSLSHGKVRSKWRFFDDMNFIRSNIRIKGSSFGDGGNSDSESDFEETPTTSGKPMVTLPPTQNIASANTATELTTTQAFQPIQLSTDWKQQNLQHKQLLLKHQLLAINRREIEASERYIRSIDAIYERMSEQQSCDSSEEQKSEDGQCATGNISEPQDMLKIEIDSDYSNEPISNEEVTPSHQAVTVEHQETRSIQPSVATNRVASNLTTPTSSQNDMEACVTTSGNSTGIMRRHRQSVIDTTSETECVHSSRNQQDTPRDTNELNDEDYHFVMSILPALRQVTRNRKFPLRSQIMTLISKELEKNNE